VPATDASSASDRGTAEAVAELFQELLRRTHLSATDDVADIVAEQAASVGASDVTVYLIDYEQASLVPVSTARSEQERSHSVAGTLPGRAFTSTSIVRSGDGAGGERLWVPLLDGTERVGVLGLSFAEPASDELVTTCERFAHLVALIVVTKRQYGDRLEVARRTQPMTIASELVWRLAPPMVFATEGLVVAGLLEPCYDNGGDALDYAVNDGVLHLGVFDAMGHGLAAVGVAALAISAYRHSRRCGQDLIDTYSAMDEAVSEQFPDRRYITAVIAQLDLASGELRWVSAGHPPPLIIRDARLVRTLAAPPSTPLGIEAGRPPTVTREQLQPGDLLLVYTDGLTDAHAPDGSRLGEDRLAAFIEREAAAGYSAPETLRRLRQAVLRQSDALGDDATALLVEWKRGREVDLIPKTAGSSARGG
jgi:hypothetical protein